MSNLFLSKTVIEHSVLLYLFISIFTFTYKRNESLRKYMFLKMYQNLSSEVDLLKISFDQWWAVFKYIFVFTKCISITSDTMHLNTLKSIWIHLMDCTKYCKIYGIRRAHYIRVPKDNSHLINHRRCLTY